MDKFKIEVVQTGYRIGYYTLDAPDEEAALELAYDIRFSDVDIDWNDFETYPSDYPEYDNIEVTRVG